MVIVRYKVINRIIDNRKIVGYRVNRYKRIRFKECKA